MPPIKMQKFKNTPKGKLELRVLEIRSVMGSGRVANFMGSLGLGLSDELVLSEQAQP